MSLSNNPKVLLSYGKTPDEARQNVLEKIEQYATKILNLLENNKDKIINSTHIDLIGTLTIDEDLSNILREKTQIPKIPHLEKSDLQLLTWLEKVRYGKRISEIKRLLNTYNVIGKDKVFPRFKKHKSYDKTPPEYYTPVATSKTVRWYYNAENPMDNLQ